MSNPINLKEFDPTIFSRNYRLKANEQELTYQEKKPRNVFKKVGDFTGVTNTSLRKVTLKADKLSREVTQEIQADGNSLPTKIEQLTNLKQNLKEVQDLGKKAKNKKIFKLFPKLFRCPDLQASIRDVQEKKEQFKSALQQQFNPDISNDNASEVSDYQSLSSSDEASLHTAQESEDFYSAVESQQETASLVSLEEFHSVQSEEENPVLQTLNLLPQENSREYSSSDENHSHVELEPEATRFVPLDNPKADAIMSFINHAGSDVGTVLQRILPPDIQSWEMDANYNFKLGFEKAHEGNFNGVKFATAQTLKGRIDPASNSVYFDENGVTGTYFITGSLLQIQQKGPANEPRIAVTGGKKVGWSTFSKTLEDTFDNTLTLLDRLEWSN